MPNWLLSMNFHTKPATSGAIINGERMNVRIALNPRYLFVSTTARTNPSTVSRTQAMSTYAKVWPASARNVSEVNARI